MTYSDEVVKAAEGIAERLRALAGELREARKGCGPGSEAFVALTNVQASMLVVNSDCGELMALVKAAVSTRQFAERPAVTGRGGKMAAAGEYVQGGED